MRFHKDILLIDSVSEIERITKFIFNNVKKIRKGGVVVGLSGGIDSATVAALCVKALGKEKVFGLLLPERESNPLSKEYAAKHARILGINYEVVDITNTLEAFGTYIKRDEIISSIYKKYDPKNHNIKITLPQDLLNKDSYNVFTLNILENNQEIFSIILKKDDLNGIIAATDTKQRIRMLHLYYFAEKMNWLVGGTTNLPETLQGFFVKYGDGGVDFEPIAHLYKSQVYQIANELGVIQEIIERTPSPDTYNSYVGDEEFYFRIPYPMVDLLLFAWRNEIPKNEVCSAMNLTSEQIERVFRDFKSKFKATQHLRELPPTIQ